MQDSRIRMDSFVYFLPWKNWGLEKYALKLILWLELLIPKRKQITIWIT